MVSALAEPRPERSRYTQGHCRRCGAYELHRTRAKTLAHQVARFTTPLVPMRCPACGTRTLRLASAASPRPSPPPLTVTPKRLKAASRRQAHRRRKIARFVAFYAAVLSLAAALGYFASRA